ncbi:MAG: hypothetical protein ACYDEC_07640 [Bacteroidia bacterium]
MPIDFFIAPCAKPNGNCQIPNVVCSTNIKHNRFGVCDDDSNLRRPAKVKLNDESSWDFTVENPNNKDVDFKAVDFCVDIYRTGIYDLDDDNRTKLQFSSDNINSIHKGLIKRCEGFLQFDDKVLFVEIKKRPKGNWLKDAREKFEETILSFMEHNPQNPNQLIEPIVSNKLFNRLHQSEMMQKKILKDKIGLEFKIQQSYTIA